MPNYLSKIKPNGANGEEYKFKDEEVREAVINVQSNITGSKTLTGDIISVSDAAPIPAENVTVVINPDQDLHGYDYPWVGGAGKNKFTGWFSSTQMVLASNVEYTDRTIDNVLGVNKTYSPNSILFVTFGVYLKAGTYCIKNFTEGVYVSFNRVAIAGTNCTGSAAHLRENGYWFTTEVDGWSWFSLERDAGYSSYTDTQFDGTELHFVIYESSETVTQWLPYSNISPISGHDMCEVVRCGKNLFGGETFADYIVANVPNAVKDSTNKTVTYTAGKINAIKIFSKFKPNTRYTFISNDISGHPNMAFYYTDGTRSIMTGSPAVSSNNKTIDYIMGFWSSGKTVIKYEQTGIFEGVLTADDFTPYTGQTYPIQIGNKNLLPLDLDTIKSFNTDGVWSGNTYELNNVALTVVTNDDGLVTEIKVVTQSSVSTDVIFKIASITYKADVEYILNGCPADGANDEYALWSFETVSGNTDVDEGDGAEIEKSSDTVASVCIRIRYLYGASNLSFKPMLRFASITNGDFSPYNPLFAQQGMCFGGELDVTNGVLVADKGFVEFDGSSDENWYQYVSTGVNQFYIGISDVKSSVGGITTDCDRFRCISIDNRSGNYNTCYAATGSICFNIQGIADVSAWKTWLASNNVQVVYKKATPIIYHLTPTEIEMLLNYNNLWANTGDVTLTYQPNNIIGEIKEYVIDNFLSKTLGLTVKDGKLCQRYIRKI